MSTKVNCVTGSVTLCLTFYCKVSSLTSHNITMTSHTGLSTTAMVRLGGLTLSVPGSFNQFDLFWDNNGIRTSLIRISWARCVVHDLHMSFVYQSN